MASHNLTTSCPVANSISPNFTLMPRLEEFLMRYPACSPQEIANFEAMLTFMLNSGNTYMGILARFVVLKFQRKFRDSIE